MMQDTNFDFQIERTKIDIEFVLWDSILNYPRSGDVRLAQLKDIYM